MGCLYVVATPIGNLNDFSKRAVDVLNDCDIILAEDTRCTIKLLNHYNIKTKMISYHKFNEKQRINEILKLIDEDKKIALVSDAGTPCISDPGYILISELRSKNIDIFAIPGCSAVISALSVGGLDTSSFSFLGFVPTDNKKRKLMFEEIKYSNIKTKVVYETANRLLKLLYDIEKKISNCMICVCSEITKIHESYKYGKTSDVINFFENNKGTIKGEYVVLISNEPFLKSDNNISVEASILNIIIKEKCTIKEAVNILNKNSDNISKKQIYNASLNLKEIIKHIK